LTSANSPPYFKAASSNLFCSSSAQYPTLFPSVSETEAEKGITRLKGKAMAAAPKKPAFKIFLRLIGLEFGCIFASFSFYIIIPKTKLLPKHTTKTMIISSLDYSRVEVTADTEKQKKQEKQGKQKLQ
jgi:hypothetical protein